MTEVEVYRPKSEVAVPGAQDTDSWITVVRDIIKIAEVIYDTPFVPDGLRGSAPAVAAAMLAGREMGLGIMTSLANIDVIRGKPSQKPLLMRAMIQAQGHKWEDVDVSDSRAVVRGCRKGESAWTTVSFTADQAKRAGLDLGKYPADKLYARATSRLARHKFADVIMGMPYSSDDLEDGLDAEVGNVASEQPEASATDKPRTAQRRTKTAPPANAASTHAAATPAAGEQRTDAGGALPPLPGEDEPPLDTDYDSPGTATQPQLTRIWATLTSDYEFARDDKDAARGLCAQIVSRPLASSKELSFKEAGIVIDTLANWIATAQAKGEHPRALMTEVLSGGVTVEEVPGE